MRIFDTGGSNPHRLVSANNAQRYAAAAAHDLSANPPIYIRANAAGVLEMTFSNGQTVAEDVLAGEVLQVSPDAVTANTTVAFTVYW